MGLAWVLHQHMRALLAALKPAPLATVSCCLITRKQRLPRDVTNRMLSALGLQWVHPAPPRSSSASPRWAGMRSPVTRRTRCWFVHSLLHLLAAMLPACCALGCCARLGLELCRHVPTRGYCSIPRLPLLVTCADVPLPW